MPIIGRFYDPKGNRLISIRNVSDSLYWDDLWDNSRDKYVYKKTASRFSIYNFYKNITKNYLAPGAVILEGGCGLALTSWHLFQAGYKVCAMDFAPRTIDYLTKNVPEVNPVLGDVKRTDFPDGMCDGYWSLGVIEHFYDGYEPIREEINRLLKPKGYLFLSFPHMSQIRRWKSRLGLYPQWKDKNGNVKNFYQYYLDEHRVIRDFEGKFEVIDRHYLGGVYGLMEESPFFKKLVGKIYYSDIALLKAMFLLLGAVLKYFSSHTVLLVLRKR